MSVYIALPLLTFILLWLGTKWPPTFNRMNEVILTANGIFSLKFIENYKRMYNQLKIFETTTTHVFKWNNLIEIVRHYMPLI
jgi:hypothetical protein